MGLEQDLHADAPECGHLGEEVVLVLEVPVHRAHRRPERWHTRAIVAPLTPRSSASSDAAAMVRTRDRAAGTPLGGAAPFGRGVDRWRRWSRHRAGSPHGPTQPDGANAVNLVG